jgi:mono/diheme cytochrome c family protein
MRLLESAIAVAVLIASAPPALGEEPGATALQRWGCLGCHAVAGTGGKVAPALDDVIERRGEEWVREKIRNPRGTNSYSIMPRLPLAAGETDDIIAYLIRVGGGDVEQEENGGDG